MANISNCPSVVTDMLKGTKRRPRVRNVAWGEGTAFKLEARMQRHLDVNKVEMLGDLRMPLEPCLAT